MALQYNLKKVYDISDNDTKFVQQIINLFLEEVPKEIKIIKNNIAIKDFTTVHTSANKIKPSLDLLGMNLAYDENIEIMKWAKAQGKKKEIQQTFKSLQEHVNLAVKEIKKDFNIT